MTKTILLTAGGTGGHLFPAQALASELQRRGHVVELATDERADKYGSAFPARAVHLIASETLRGKSPLKLAKTAWSLLRGTWQARRVIKRLKPDVVVGFGGYPTFPPMFAARLTGTPSILHEANGVMGRANVMLAGGVTAVATSLPLAHVADEIAKRSVETGNPVRDAVIEVAATPYPALGGEGVINLLVFGGSQGARSLNRAVVRAHGLWSQPGQLQILHAAGASLHGEAAAAWEKARSEHDGPRVRCVDFIEDMGAAYAAADIVVCRAGATSIAELTALGRPSVLVPYPHATRDHQMHNAKALAQVGGAQVIEDGEFSARRLVDAVEPWIADADARDAASRAARVFGRRDAATQVARIALDLVRDGRPSTAGGAA